ncbi:MAG TPA: peptide chain release factor N(5)-glutamine methyltransferase [Candidatus Kapabacteria bacterium]
MLWDEAIRNASRSLHDEGIDDAELNAELLAVHLKGEWKRSDMARYMQDPLTPEEEVEYEHLINRRIAHQPLQYITGETEFFGLRLFTSAAALIPRPDTEVLVEATLEEIASLSKENVRILDIGTGSGAIILALASGLKRSECVGIDISNEALTLAERNKNRLGLTNVSFTNKNIFDNIELGSFDVIVSNPPYISTDEMRLLGKEVIDYEPRIALTDESDGLTFYKEIIQKATGPLLNDGGLLLFEVGFDASCHVAALMKNAGFQDVELTNDLSGIGRVICGRKNLDSQM